MANTKFTERNLVDFGNYLLSNKRKRLFSLLSTDNLEDRLSKVHDADVANFIDSLRAEAEEGRLMDFAQEVWRSREFKPTFEEAKDYLRDYARKLFQLPINQ